MASIHVESRDYINFSCHSSLGLTGSLIDLELTKKARLAN